MLVYSPKGDFIADVPALHRVLKEEFKLLPVFLFSLPQELHPLAPLEGSIETPFGRFILKERKKSGEEYDYVAKADIDALTTDLVTKAYVTMTVAEMGADLLDGTGWTIQSSATEKRTVTLDEETRYAGVLAIVNRFMYEIHWDIMQKIITIEPHIGRENSGLYIHDQVNLRDVSPAEDSYDLITRITPRGADGMGIESINGGVPYLENFSYTNKVKAARLRDERYTVVENLKAYAQKILDERSKVRQAFQADVSDLAAADPAVWGFLDFRVGDSVDLVSTREGIDQKQRIIERTRYLDEVDADTLTIANTLRDDALETQTDLEDVRATTTSNRASLKLLEDSVESKVSSETYGNDQEALGNTLERLASGWEQTADGFMQEVEKTYTSKGEFSSFQEILSTKFSQDEETFDFKFTEIVKSVETIDGQQVEKFSEIEKHITFESGDIVLKATNSDPTVNTRISLRIARDRISFLDNGAEVAYISDNKLYILDGHFLNVLRVGNFSFRPRTNGSLSFGRVT